jgi:hypothetical protein
MHRYLFFLSAEARNHRTVRPPIFNDTVNEASDCAQVTPDAKFKEDLGLDSLDTVEVSTLSESFVSLRWCIMRVELHALGLPRFFYGIKPVTNRIVERLHGKQ